MPHQESPNCESFEELFQASDTVCHVMAFNFTETYSIVWNFKLKSSDNWTKSDEREMKHNNFASISIAMPVYPYNEHAMFCNQLERAYKLWSRHNDLQGLGAMQIEPRLILPHVWWSPLITFWYLWQKLHQLSCLFPTVTQCPGILQAHNCGFSVCICTQAWLQ